MAQTAPPSSASAAQTIYAQSPPSASILAQRRRSTAAHARPAGPPPSHPIPNLPPAGPPPAVQLPRPPVDDRYDDQPYSEGRPSIGSRSQSAPFARPAASPGLAAVASFAEARDRQAAASSSSLRAFAPVSPSSEDLLDPPPPSLLLSRSAHEPPPPPSPDRLEPPQENRRPPSSRRALTRALELAREAVELDSSNVDPEAAVMAYGRSVALLSEVMERVRRGEDSTDPRRRNGRRRSVVAQEEEIRRLQQIHDTYADRMNILSLIYSIPPIPYNSASMYAAASTSEASTRSPSPSASTSTRSESAASSRDHHDDGSSYDRHSGVEAIGSAVFMASSDEGDNSSSSSHHPYAAASQVESQLPPPQIVTPTATLPGTRTSILRARSNSAALPPPAPPPLTSPPPAPSQSADNSPNIPPASTHHLTVVGRQRGNSINHRRTGSGSRLASLQEEQERYDPASAPREDEYVGRGSMSETPRAFAKESPPLPPIPSPTSDAPNTPRSQPATLPPSPRTTAFVVPRPRGASQLASVRQDTVTPPIINQTTNQGTIYQRRSKMSAPASSDTSSPTESSVSLASTSLPKASAISLTSSSSSSSATGGPTSRSRSSSQPGRRPSIVNGQIQSPPGEMPPPLPMNGAAPRKVSIPQKLNPYSLTVQTDMIPPALAASSPMTPVSPLPPAAPSDALLKPYHMMNLLRATMESATGGYVTRRLHVPQEVWSQGGAKLNNTSEKVRVVAILCSALEDLALQSSEYFGAGNVSSGLAMGIGSITRKEADAWQGKLEEFSAVCDGVVASFGKKLSVGEGFVVKKSTWSDRMTRSFDKLTNNGKTLDSPAAYVQGLRKLFLHVQLLDEHTKAVKAHPVAPAYAAFPIDMRASIEAKLKRCSEFFATVILTFVIRDLAQLLDKYVKRCEKWLEE
ncbi:hypothetical protein FB107DRAFT_253680 [Schizophyllum commune]